MGQTYYKNGGLPAEVVAAVHQLVYGTNMTEDEIMGAVFAYETSELRAVRFLGRYVGEGEANADKLEAYLHNFHEQQGIDKAITEYDYAVEEAKLAETSHERRIAEGKAWGICIALTALGYDVPGVTRDRGKANVGK